MTDSKQSGGSVRSITFQAQFVNLDMLREFVKQAALECGLDPKAVYAVQLAVDEGTSNIIEHAYGGECLEFIDCTCEIDTGKLTVTLKDCGLHFKPEEIPMPDLTADIEEREIGGIGLYLMRQLMDEVHYRAVPGGNGEIECNILTLVKRKGV